jgi:KaiC/GvpD/RAD55 family RecA-like ATPase
MSWGGGMTTTEKPLGFKPVERGTRKVTETEYAKQKYYRKTGEFHQFKLEEVPDRGIVSSSLFEGYAAGSIVSVIGAPKTGKTQFCIQECAMASSAGYDCLYMYNESPRIRFMSIVAKKIKDMKLGENDLKGITFANMHGEILGSAGYAAIEAYISRTWVGKVEQWLRNARKPRFVVIDSISKIGRQYIPQLFKVAEVMCSGLANVMDDTGKYPVVLIIHQKSGGYFEKFDDSVVGGAGLVHEGDGVMVFKRYDINRKLASDTGLRWGDKLYSMQIDSRDIDVTPFERVVRIIDGKMKAFEGLHELEDTTKRAGFKNKGWQD